MNNKQARPRIGRWVGIAVAVVAGVVLAWWALQPRPLLVDVATVREGRFEQAVEEDGRLRPAHRYSVTSPVQGRLERPTVEVGNRVQAGDVLAVVQPVAPALIDARTRGVLQQRVGAAEASRATAEAQWRQAQVAAEQARADVQRTRELARQGFVAPSALEQAERAERAATQALAAAEAERRRADFAAAEARAALRQAEGGGDTSRPWLVRSPVAGRVLKRHQDSAVPVGVGQPLFDIADLSALEAVVDVLSSDALRIAVGTSVTLSPGAGLPLLSARVVRVEPTAFTKVSALGVEEQRVPVVVALDDGAQAPALGDGYRVEARIVLSAQDRALLVPGGALVRDGAGWRVLVVNGERAEARRVTVRDRNAEVAWVTDGVQPGETVVLYPGQMVQDGQRVRPRTAGAPGG